MISPALIDRLGSASALATTVNQQYLRQLCQKAEAEGLSVGGLLRQAGLTEMALDRPVALGALCRVIDALQASLPRDDLALEVALGTPPGAHGPLVLLLTSAPTLRLGLLDLIRFYLLRTRALQLTLEDQRTSGVLAVRPALALGQHELFLLEWALANLLGLLAAAKGAAMSACAFELPRPKVGRAWIAAAKSWGMPAPTPGSGAIVQLPAGLLDQAQATANTMEYRHAWRTCNDLLRQQEEARQHVARLSTLLVTGGADHEFRQGELARRLGLSTAAMRRHLRVEGLSFDELVEFSRRRQAWALLRESSLPIAEVAGKLGYRDASNFSRSCRRWFGMTPGDLRRAAADSKQ